MKFLHGLALTNEMKRLCAKAGKLDLAIAYWGSRALHLLKLDPERPDVRVICCLKGGKSAPEVIKLFGAKARQLDNLHAKVIWTEYGAIVGSANASSNGLPEEEDSSDGLLEAGVLVQDPAELKAIADWFQKLFEHESKKIEAFDLELAALARKPSNGGIPSLTEFIVALRGRVPPQVPIALAMYSDSGTKEQRRFIEQALEDTQQAKKIRAFLNISDKAFEKLDWYIDWPELPPDHFLIDCHIRNGRIRMGNFLHTFEKVRGWPGHFGNDAADYYFVSDRGSKGPHCRLTKTDAKLLEACSAELWKAAAKEGDNEGRVLSLSEAAPILYELATTARAK
ncbi:phospholipase D family protein [Bradyrhizobium sp. CCGB01]|uniref:phospholipase D family protein n=1 Tax=Bradyrhizobium sp. CCGB01 TaxID=2949634 RepID=UPI0020B1C551|nr:phospholipase D family protein [Bradyrhizobium sp. CCGB01]MCP3404059.1 phospholipase D family protein [Bradyrhizobium sp. CCGB01]